VARIVSHRQEPGYYQMCGVRAPGGEGHDYYRAVKSLRVTNLTIGGEVWMVDDPLHWYGTLEAAATYEGHVLCAGLGLGLIVHALRANPKVTKITVVERSLDVIELVWPHLAPNGRPDDGKLLTVWRGDWWEVRPGVLADLVGPVDGVFFDLLVGHGPDLVGEAIYATKDARKRWPGVPCRVFGMNDCMLRALIDASERGNAEAQRQLDERQADRKKKRLTLV
jgi:hypothetical protein